MLDDAINAILPCDGRHYNQFIVARNMQEVLCTGLDMWRIRGFPHFGGGRAPPVSQGLGAAFEEHRAFGYNAHPI